jgi:lipid-A-disaccharide synthase
MPRLLVSSGEPSGDLYGAELVRQLRGTRADVEVFGLGGDHLLGQGAHLLAHVRDLAVVGLLEVVSHLRRLRRVFRSVLEEVDRRPPDAAVLIDYPDFNLRLAKELRRRGVPVVYYVSPQVWAWRRGRLRTIRETVERMLVIFPFEEAIYREAAIPVRFVGHPLVDLVAPPSDRAAFLQGLGLDPERPLLAVLPGSRPREVALNLPPLAGGLRKIHAQRPDVQLVLALAPPVDEAATRAVLGSVPVRLVRGQTHGILATATAALVASGTATVEAALLGAPLVVVYRLTALTYHLGRHLVRVPHFAMVNLIAGRRVATELIQAEFTADRVAEEGLRLLSDDRYREALRDDLEEVRKRLGGPGASARAAAEVDDVLAGIPKKS